MSLTRSCEIRGSFGVLLAAVFALSNLIGCVNSSPSVVSAPSQPQEVNADGGPSQDADVEAPEAVQSEQPVTSASSTVVVRPRQPSKETEIITFDDINLGMGPDARFRPFMLSDRPAQELIGKRVNIAGFINPTDRLKGITDFILLRNLECKFGPGGQADHLVHVLMQDGSAADFTDQTVYVEGELVLHPFHSPDGSATWSVFDLKADRVSLRPPPRRR